MMEIDDPGDALQFDFALAYKHDREDKQRVADYLDSIQEMLRPIGEALGVKYQKGTKKTVEPSKALPDDLPVEEVLKRIGGKNIMVHTNGKQ